MEQTAQADTIVAIATAQGNGAIGIIRLSGPQALVILHQVWLGGGVASFKNKQLYPGKIMARTPGDSTLVLDHVLCYVARAPHSYTGEDVVEIQAHGGRWLLEKIVSTLVAAGARLADPGEFTCRAFHNGKMDLVQAEGVADLIAATSERAATLARRQLEGRLSETVGKMRRDLLVMRAQMEAMIDFPEDEDVQGLQGKEVAERIQILERQIRQILSTYREGRALREGVRVALIGKPNVGKSSLLNALLQQDCAIVHETPGTTRDLIEEVMDLEGLQVRFIDTAGIRGEPDAIEAEGIRRTQERLMQSDLILALFDSNRPLDADDQAILGLIKGREAFRLITKVDLAPKFDASELTGMTEIFSISAKRGDGIEALKREIRNYFVDQSRNTEVLLTHLRHKLALERGLVAMEKVREGATQKTSLEFLAADLTMAANALGEITGEISTDEVLGEIFSKFCLGK